MPETNVPRLQVINRNRIVVTGCWRVGVFASRQVFSSISSCLQGLPDIRHVSWDLSQLIDLDYICALFLWDAWGRTRPEKLRIRPEHEVFFQRLEKTGSLYLKRPDNFRKSSWAFFRRAGCSIGGHFVDFVTLTGQLVLDVIRFARQPQKGPWKEISATIYSAGTRAVGITALVGFLIGVVLSYLSAQQLHNFGGDPFLVDLLGIGITRELGPLLAAILVAGRSGSSMTAQIGVMRVTDELDAMAVMGMPHGFRLVLPKVIALAIVMPLLTMWTVIVAMIGGMIAAQVSIGLSMDFFLAALPEAVPMVNLYIGLGKGVVFGILIALIACHFGLRIKPDTESLGQGTTSAVVTGITMVMLADALFAIMLQNVGWS